MNKTVQALLAFSLLIYLATVGIIQFICGLVLVVICEVIDYVAWSKANKKMKDMIGILRNLTEELEKENKPKKQKTNTKNKKKGE